MSALFPGPRYLLQGFRLIFQPGIRRFVVLPLIINSLIFAALISFGGVQFNRLVDWLVSFIPAWMSWLAWLLWPVFALIAVIFIFFTFTLFANFIGAPFNGLLAEAVEEYLTGRKQGDQSWATLMRDLLASLGGELRKIVYYLLWAFPLLLLFLIPGINLLAPLVWIAFSSWIMTLQYSDYPMSNHGLSFPQQRRLLATRRTKAMSFGGATLFATLIPGVNFLVMPAAVAGATLMWLDLFAERSGGINQALAPASNL